LGSPAASNVTEQTLPTSNSTVASVKVPQSAAVAACAAVAPNSEPAAISVADPAAINFSDIEIL
jgi:hypothetical protein